MSEKLIEFKNVFSGYDKEDVIKDISFEISSGENLCFLGKNGCGKTTLVRTLCGLLPYRGEAKILGKEVNKYKAKELARVVASLGQIGSLYFSYSVFDTVMLGRYARIAGGALSKPSKLDEQFVMECLERLKIADIKDKMIDTLSGGQLQRVFLARAFCQEPDIIVLDEPTNHLDVKSQEELIIELKKWSKDKKHTVIGVMHDLMLSLELFDKGVILKDGEVVCKGELKEISTRENLKNAYDSDVIEFLKKISRNLEGK